MNASLRYGLLALVLLAGGSLAAWYLLQDRLVPAEPRDALPAEPLLLLRLPDPAAWPAAPAEGPVDAALAGTGLLGGLREACAAWNGGPVGDGPSAEGDSSAAPAGRGLPGLTRRVRAEGPLWAAAYLGAGGRLDWLLVRREGQGPAAPAGADRFEGVDLVRAGGQRWTFRHRGLRVLAAHRALAEDAIRRVQGITDAPEDVDLERLRTLTGKNREATVYASGRQLAAYLGLFALPALANGLDGLGAWTDWAALDLRLLDDAVFLSGYAGGGDPTVRASLAARFPAAGAAEWRIDEILPARTACFWRVAAGDSLQGLFRPDYAASTADLDDPWRRLAAGEWAFALHAPQDADWRTQALWALRLADPGLADETLAPLSDAEGLYEGRAVRRFNGSEPALSLRFGQALAAFDTAWFARVGDFLVATPTRAGLERAIDRHDRGETLRGNLAYAAFRERLLPSAGATLYLDLPALAPLAPALATERAAGPLGETLRGQGALRPVALQFDRYRDFFLASGFVVAGPSAEGPAATGSLWTLRLDTVAAAAPRFVRDHRNGRTELLLEDAAHGLYLVDAGGERLWKRTLDGPVLGDVHQIDYYRNGKLQYAFATPGRIHLMDRNGENVADFPIALSAGAASGLQVFDYDGKRDYRLFVGGDNDHLYGYYQTGKPLPGWNPMKRTGRVHVPLAHVARNGKDYIAIASAEGGTWVVDRRGVDRHPPLTLAAPLLDAWVPVAENGEPLWMGCDTLGTVYRLHLDGTLDRRATPRVDASSRFAVANLDGREGVEWLVLARDRVDARNADATPRWSWDLPNGDPHGWTLSGSGPRTLVSVWSPVSGEWTVLDAAGEPLPGFPAPGGGPCAVGPLTGEGSRVFVGARGAVVEARPLP